jgi:hypothetical protein
MSDKNLAILIFVILVLVGLSSWGASNTSSPSDTFDGREQVYTL